MPRRKITEEERKRLVREKQEKILKDLEKAEKKYEKCHAAFKKSESLFAKRQETLLDNKLRPAVKRKSTAKKAPPRPPRPAGTGPGTARGKGSVFQKKKMAKVRAAKK